MDESDLRHLFQEDDDPAAPLTSRQLRTLSRRQRRLGAVAAGVLTFVVAVGFGLLWLRVTGRL